LKVRRVPEDDEIAATMVGASNPLYPGTTFGFGNILDANDTQARGRTQLWCSACASFDSGVRICTKIQTFSYYE
jgi:hypothetical protein